MRRGARGSCSQRTCYVERAETRTPAGHRLPSESVVSPPRPRVRRSCSVGRRPAPATGYRRFVLHFLAFFLEVCLEETCAWCDRTARARHRTAYRLPEQRAPHRRTAAEASYSALHTSNPRPDASVRQAPSRQLLVDSTHGCAGGAATGHRACTRANSARVSSAQHFRKARVLVRAYEAPAA